MKKQKTELFETGLDGSEVSRRYMKAARDMQKNEIFAAFYLAEVEKRRLWHEQGYSSVIHFAVDTGDITEGKAYGLLRVGKGLQEHPVLRTAAVEGRIPWTKARELFRLKESMGEEELLEKATSLSSRDLEDFVTDRNKFYRAKQKRLRAGIERAVSAAVSAGTIGEFPATAANMDFPAGKVPFGVDSVVEPLQTGDIFSEVAAGPGSSAGKEKNSDTSAAGESGEAAEQGATVFLIEQNHPEPEPLLELVTVTLKLTPEEFTILKEAHRVWKRLNKGERNKGEWKRERMFTTLSKLYLEETAITAYRKRNEVPVGDAAGIACRKPEEVPVGDAAGIACRKRNELPVGDAAEVEKVAAVVGKAQPDSPVILDSPYSIFIIQNSESGRNMMVGKHGDMLEVDKALFEQAMCDGAVYDVDENGMPGRKKRSVSRALRKKIFMRDRGVCCAPGCGNSSFLEIHHVTPLSKGGSNDPSNMALLCSCCHRHIHEGRLVLKGSYPELKFRRVVKIDVENRRV